MKTYIIICLLTSTLFFLYEGHKKILKLKKIKYKRLFFTGLILILFILLNHSVKTIDTYLTPVITLIILGAASILKKKEFTLSIGTVIALITILSIINLMEFDRIDIISIFMTFLLTLFLGYSKRISLINTLFTATGIPILLSIKLFNLNLSESLNYITLWMLNVIIYYAIALTKEHQKQKLNTLSNKSKLDFLTGLQNRRGFDEDIKQMEIEYDKPLCIIMADIDFFKKINDTYGHDIGDDVLKSISNHFKLKIRTCDKIYRLGGEEFAILIKDCDILTGYLTATRLKDSLQGFHIPNTKQEVTVSFGISVIKNKENINIGLIQADKALYESKNNGRNRVSIYKNQNLFFNIKGE